MLDYNVVLICFFKWAFKVPILVKPASQYSHLKGFALPWTRRLCPEISPLHSDQSKWNRVGESSEVRHEDSIIESQSPLSYEKVITILELNFSLQIEQENIFLGSLLVGMSELFKLPFSCNTTSEFEFPFIMSLRSKRAFFGEFLYGFA